MEKLIELKPENFVPEAVTLTDKELKYLVKKYPTLTLDKAIPLAVSMKKMIRKNKNGK